MPEIYRYSPKPEQPQGDNDWIFTLVLILLVVLFLLINSSAWSGNPVELVELDSLRHIENNLK